jgi:Flp pilus assembly protein TadB
LLNSQKHSDTHTQTDTDTDRRAIEKKKRERYIYKRSAWGAREECSTRVERARHRPSTFLVLQIAWSGTKGTRIQSAVSEWIIWQAEKMWRREYKSGDRQQAGGEDHNVEDIILSSLFFAVVVVVVSFVLREVILLLFFIYLCFLCFLSFFFPH